MYELYFSTFANQGKSIQFTSKVNNNFNQSASPAELVSLNLTWSLSTATLSQSLSKESLSESSIVFSSKLSDDSANSEPVIFPWACNLRNVPGNQQYDTCKIYIRTSGSHLW